MDSEPAAQKGGFDASASCREHDHLNRWPFAQEIYGIATTGSKEWSVRVGIYGEWGTGKTSVLNFIARMANADGHVAVRFNPWEYSDSRALWHAFVASLDSEFQKHAPKWEPYDWGRWKNPVWKLIDRIRKKLNLPTGSQRVTLPVLGIELLRDFCAYSRKDLQRLLIKAQPTRVLILIDDLDRTSATVVPEIFFALKEVMDIPGVAFICAFDPEVVGEVLKERHPGLGDGLKFLEKIIDYPRCLPVPTAEGLMNLALADAKESCDYIPVTALRDAVPLLPANPRAVRQFIRILALLLPQIERHYPTELRWPTILAANVLKVRHPRLAHPLLNDDDFWKTIEATGLLGTAKANELGEAIKKHVDKVSTSQRVKLDDSERGRIEEAMQTLCSQINPWFGIDAAALAYQMNVAEAPHAVTWKEFDSFLARWGEKPTVETADTWISEQARRVGRLYIEVYRESFDASLQRYVESRQSAESVLVAAERPTEFAKAETIFTLVKCLTSQLGLIGETDKRFDAERFGILLKQFASLPHRTATATYETFRTNETALLMALVREWTPDIGPLVRVLQPFHPSLFYEIETPDVKVLHRQLCAEALPKFARQILEQFRESDFVSHIIDHRKQGYEAVNILLNVNGPLWKESRRPALDFFRSESRNPVVRENIFKLLHWMDHRLQKESQGDETTDVKNLLKDAEIVNVLWMALTSIQLSPRPIAWLKDLPKRLQELGTTVVLPAWWNEPIETPGIREEAPPEIEKE